MPRAISASASCWVASRIVRGDVRVQRAELGERMELEAPAGEVAVDETVGTGDVGLRRGRPVLREVVVVGLQLPNSASARGAVSLPTNGEISESATTMRPPRSGGSPRASEAARRISARYDAAAAASILPVAAARLTAAAPVSAPERPRSPAHRRQASARRPRRPRGQASDTHVGDGRRGARGLD